MALTQFGNMKLDNNLCHANCTDTTQGVCSALAKHPKVAFCECAMGWDGPACAHDCSLTGLLGNYLCDALGLYICFVVILLYTAIGVVHVCICAIAVRKKSKITAEDPAHVIKRRILGLNTFACFTRAVYHFTCKLQVLQNLSRLVCSLAL